MGQGEILKILEREKKWLSATEISLMVESNSYSIASKLRTMFKYSEVLRKKDKEKTYTKYLWMAK